MLATAYQKLNLFITDIFNDPADQQWIDRAASENRDAWSPGWQEAWWWLAIPILTAGIVLAVGIAAPQFFLEYMLPEGYGVLEFGHFIVPLVAFAICAWLFFRPSVKRNSLVRTLTGLFAFACLYIAGEEQSWGQHFFGWSTPEYWSEINRQQETNLHNTLGILNHLPQKILEIGIFLGGIVMPLWERIRRPFEHWFLRLYVPAAALLPVALVCVAFKSIYWLHKTGPSAQIIARPSEPVETMLYLFILFYVIVYARRILSLDKTPR